MHHKTLEQLQKDLAKTANPVDCICPHFSLVTGNCQLNSNDPRECKRLIPDIKQN